MLFEDTELGYTLQVIDPEREWIWGIQENLLKEDFVYLGDNFETMRFAFIE
jgi:hypothetical protein